MSTSELQSVARLLVAPGKGILAADESAPTIEKRFKSVKVPSTEENRRAYRELLFTTDGIEEFISGVILFDETIRQKASDGTAFPDIVFLSGGQTPEQATGRLSAMNAMGSHPWELSFSYGRALQDPVLKAWKGEPGNTAAARKAFFHRARCNGAARHGRYTEEMEKPGNPRTTG